MDFAEWKKSLESSASMQAISESAEAKKLLQRVDASAVERAVKRGDTEALKGVLAQVLSTPEGRALAEKVQKAVRRDG